MGCWYGVIYALEREEVPRTMEEAMTDKQKRLDLVAKIAYIIAAIILVGMFAAWLIWAALEAYHN